MNECKHAICVASLFSSYPSAAPSPQMGTGGGGRLLASKPLPKRQGGKAGCPARGFTRRKNESIRETKKSQSAAAAAPAAAPAAATYVGAIDNIQFRKEFCASATTTTNDNNRIINRRTASPSGMRPRCRSISRPTPRAGRLMSHPFPSPKPPPPSSPPRPGVIQRWAGG
jgi:hypothetical protein